MVLASAQEPRGEGVTADHMRPVVLEPGALLQVPDQLWDARAGLNLEQQPVVRAWPECRTSIDALSWLMQFSPGASPRRLGTVGDSSACSPPAGCSRKPRWWPQCMAYRNVAALSHSWPWDTCMADVCVFSQFGSEQWSNVLVHAKEVLRVVTSS